MSLTFEQYDTKQIIPINVNDDAYDGITKVGEYTVYTNATLQVKVADVTLQACIEGLECIPSSRTIYKGIAACPHISCVLAGNIATSVLGTIFKELDDVFNFDKSLICEIDVHALKTPSEKNTFCRSIQRDMYEIFVTTTENKTEYKCHKGTQFSNVEFVLLVPHHLMNKDIEIISKSNAQCWVGVTSDIINTRLPQNGSRVIDTQYENTAFMECLAHVKSGGGHRGGTPPTLLSELVERIVKESIIQWDGESNIAIKMENHLKALASVNASMRKTIFETYSTTIDEPAVVSGLYKRSRDPIKLLTVASIKEHLQKHASNELLLREGLFHYLVSVIALERRRLFVSRVAEVTLTLSGSGMYNVKNEDDVSVPIHIFLVTRATEVHISFSAQQHETQRAHQHETQRAHQITVNFHPNFIRFVESEIPMMTQILTTNALEKMYPLPKTRKQILGRYRSKWKAIGTVHYGNKVPEFSFPNIGDTPTKLIDVQALNALRNQIVTSKLTSLERLYGMLVYHFGDLPSDDPILFAVSGYNIDTIARMVVDGFVFRCDAHKFDSDTSIEYQRIHTTCVQKFVMSRFERDPRNSFKPYITSVVDQIAADVRALEVEQRATYASAVTKLQQHIADFSKELDTRYTSFTGEEMKAITQDPGTSKMYYDSLTFFSGMYDFLDSLSRGIDPRTQPGISLDMFKEMINVGEFLKKGWADRQQAVFTMKRNLAEQAGLRILTMRKVWVDYMTDAAKAVAAMDDARQALDSIENTLHTETTPDIASALRRVEQLLATPVFTYDGLAPHNGQDIATDVGAIMHLVNTNGGLDARIVHRFEKAIAGSEDFKKQIDAFKTIQERYKRQAELQATILALQSELNSLLVHPGDTAGGGKLYTYKKAMHKLQNKALNLQKPTYTLVNNKKKMLFVRYKRQYILVSDYQRLKRQQGSDWKVDR
jgi:hypothetical protein